MIRPNPHSDIKISIALFLIGVMLANFSYQYMDSHQPESLAIDICDHSDSESECDKKESGETDDIISHDVRSFTFFASYLSTKNGLLVLSYPVNHPEIVSPPPEY